MRRIDADKLVAELQKKPIHESPWTSWFVGDYVEQLEPIELEVRDA